MNIYTKDSNERLLTEIIAKDFICLPTGSMIKTITTYADEYDMARGTVQQALRILQYGNAAEIKARGRRGTFLESKAINKLMAFADITSLSGAIPNPYAQTIELVSKEIMETLEASLEIPVFLTYYHKPSKKIDYLLEDKIQFALVSKYEAKQLISEGKNIEIAHSFGLNTYVNDPVEVIRKGLDYKDGIKVAINLDAMEQNDLIKSYLKNEEITFVNTPYRDDIAFLFNKQVDAIIVNRDDWNIISDDYEIRDLNVPKALIEDYQDASEAVIITNLDFPEYSVIIKDCFQKVEVTES